MQYDFSNVNLINTPDTYQPFTVVFGIGVATLAAACSALIYKSCKYGYGIATREESRYTFIKQIPLAIRGRNLNIELVFSKSKRDNSKRNKLWFFKPVVWEPGSYIYNLELATKETYFGTLIVELLNKECAAKTKFNLYDAGVVSRIPGDDATKVIDLFNFCLKRMPLPIEVQKHFMQILILGIILGNRDMRLENFVVALDHNNVPSFVYAIDHELGGSEPLESFRPLVDVLHKISINPKQIIHLLMDKRFKWNYASSKINFDQSVFDFYAEALLGSITTQECLDIMDVIATRLAYDDFKICLNIKQKVLSKIVNHEYTYSSSDINKTIIPTIDRSIESIANNVNITKRFLRLEPATKPRLRG